LGAESDALLGAREGEYSLDIFIEVP